MIVIRQGASGSSSAGVSFVPGPTPYKFTGTEYSDAQDARTTQQESDSDWFAAYQENGNYYTILLYTGTSSADEDITVEKASIEYYDSDNSEWVVLETVIGVVGPSAEDVQIQYSADGVSNWHSTQAGSDDYWRWSVDGGATWSNNYVRFTPETESVFPSPYDVAVTSDGLLGIYEDETLIGTWSTDGLWVINEVTTGTGSFHLGSYLSIGSGVDQVSFVTEDNHKAFFPSWGSVMMDGSAATAIQNRRHGDYAELEPVGDVDTSTTLDFDFEVTSTTNECVLSFDFVPAEDYTGGLTWKITRNDLEVNSNRFEVALTSGTLTHHQLHYPVWLQEDETATLTLTKDDDDGEALLVYAGADNAAIPYRKLYIRSFTDYGSFDTGNWEDIVTLINETYTSGDEGILWSALDNVPTASDSTKGILMVNSVALSVDTDGNLTLDQSQIDATKIANLSQFLSGGLQGVFDETATVEDFQDWLLYSWGKFLPDDVDATLTLGSYTLTYGDIIWHAYEYDADEVTIDSDNFDTYYAHIVENLFAADPTENYSVLIGDSAGGKTWSATPTINVIKPSSMLNGYIGTQELPYAELFIGTIYFYDSFGDDNGQLISEPGSLIFSAETDTEISLQAATGDSITLSSDGTVTITGDTTVNGTLYADTILPESDKGDSGSNVGSTAKPYELMATESLNLVPNDDGSTLEARLWTTDEATTLVSYTPALNIGLLDANVLGSPNDMVIDEDEITFNKDVVMTDNLALGDIDNVEAAIAAATTLATVLDIKTGLQTADHNGWILMDGRLVSTLTDYQQANVADLGWTSIPNMSNYITRGVGTSTLGNRSGSWYIQRANLPNVDIGSSSMTIKPYGSVTITDPGHSHSFAYTLLRKYGDATKSNTNGGDGDGSGLSGTESSTTGISATFSGSSRNYTTPEVYLNGNVTQTVFNPPTLGVNYFIYLGTE